MSQFFVSRERKSDTHGNARAPALALAAGMLLGALSSAPAFAGGADVSTDEIYSDGITLTTEDGSPLDIDGDGNVDLAVAANRGGAAGRSRYYLGNGDGTFSAPVLLTAGASSHIAAGHMDSDTFVDLVQGRRDATDLLYLGDGAGGVATGIAISADTTRTLDIALGDLDNDGDLDIVTGNGRPGGTGAPQPNRFYLNDNIPNGTNNFAAADVSADEDDTRSIALVDIDGDGDLDIIAGNDETTANSNRIYLNQFVESGNTTVSFAAGIDFGNANDQTAKILIGDLNNNGLPDIVVLNHVSTPLSPGINRFYLNETVGGVLQLGAETDVSADTDNTGGGVLADFDGDGDLDLVVFNLIASGPGQSSRTRLYLNQFIETGTVSFAAAVDVSDDEQMSRGIDAADINDDGHIDLIVGNQDQVTDISGRDRRYLNNGTTDPFTNIAPVIDSQAGPLETDEETALTIELEDVEVTDPDNVFPTDFTLTVQAGDNYTFTDNTVTPDDGFDGELLVSVIVNDGTDDSEAFDLTVTVHNTINSAPSFTSTAVTAADEGVAYTYNITTDDPDPSDTLTITAPILPGWLNLVDNGDGTASLTGIPAATDVGDHDVSLEVSDGLLTEVQEFTITVTAAAPGNSTPSFTSTPVTDATPDEAYSYEVTATDPDGDTLTITATSLPSWLTFEDNGDGSASLTGTPASGDAGDHNVSLQVSDGSLSALQAFTITVAGATGDNNAPQFTSSPVTDATEGTTYTYDVTASDADADDTLEITAPTLPAWLMLADNGDGSATLTGTAGAGDVGDHDVTLEVSDGTDTATQSFTITVVAAGPPPTFPPPPFGGGGGSLGFLTLLALGSIGAARARGRRN